MIMKEILISFQRKKWWKQTRLARVLLIYFYVCIVGPFLVLHPLVLLLHLKAFLHVLSGNAACGNNRTCCMMGECNCACMPLQKPFGRSALFVSAFLFFFFSSLSLVLVVFSLTHPFFGLPFFLFFPLFLYFCVVIIVLCCAFSFSSLSIGDPFFC